MQGDQLGAMKHLNELIEKWELMQQSRIAYSRGLKELQNADHRRTEASEKEPSGII